jgi:hypothetical protein
MVLNAYKTIAVLEVNYTLSATSGRPVRQPGTLARELMKRLGCRYLLADKGYGADWF